MIVHAVTEGDTTEERINALEGWTFEGVKGTLTIRAEDHALLQPMYQVRLVGSGADATPELIAEIPAADVEPPVAE